MKGSTKFTFFILGVLATLVVVLLWRSCQEKPQQINQDYYLLTNQLQKMNKMVVLEQNYSAFQTHKDAAFSYGGYDFLPKELVLYTTARAQVTFDMNALQYRVDSINKKLIIEKLPKAKIEVFPSAKIYFMDDYALNRYDKATLQSVIDSAKKNMTKKIDEGKLRQEGRKQLLENLHQLFILAHALHYDIVDETQSLKAILP